MKTPDSTYFDHPTINPRYINKNYPELYKHLTEHYGWTRSISEAMYCWKNGIQDIPCCEVCGKKVRFTSFKKGYSNYCSVACSNRSILQKNKVKQTNLDRYGVENPNQNKTVREKIKKTNLERYGYENPSSNKDVQEKIKQTNMERYGVEYSCLNDDVKEKAKQTNMERYGVEYGVQTEQAKKNLVSSRIAKQLSTHDDIVEVDYEQHNYICSCPHPECDKCESKQYAIRIDTYFDRKRDNTELCTHLLPYNKDRNCGTTIELFIRNILDEYGIEYITNSRSIIPPQELDIYIPSHHMAIECNGIYWHSTKPSRYHMEKFIRCQEQGIQLLTIWEDWIVHHPDIVRSILLSKLGMNHTIYARKCVLREIDAHTANEFLDLNHIQGRSYSKVKIGMFHNDELVSVMVFGARQTMSSKNPDEWDLIRFCNKLNYNVIGAASKMLKYFVTYYHPSTIYSFSSNDISDGHLYKTLGFHMDTINQSYWYIDKKYKRHHRSSFTKDAIVRRGWRQDKNGWREVDVMDEYGYYQIYDSGQTKWVLKNKNYERTGL